VSVEAQATPGRLAATMAELAKVPAFGRRDLIDAWSYRASFFADVGTMVVQIVTFYFVGKMVEPGVLPEYGGVQVDYVSFVAVGIAVNVFLAVGLGRVAGALRTEQWKGTLEVLLMTPTALSTIQLGSVLYDLVYIPLRTAIFLTAVVIIFGVDIEPSGLGPAIVLILFFIPFVWGLGLVSAGSILTFKGASFGVSIAVTAMTLLSGAYFPLDLLPGWASTIAEANPLAVAIDGARDALLGGSDWSGIPEKIAVLVPAALFSLAAGILAFRLALARERRRGTLALY
jgi:ABC-2 type transport system permease protein